MKRVDIADSAKAELNGIGRYTENNFGAAQKARYLRRLHDAMTRLAENPRLGVARDDVAIGYRCLHSGRHMIYYRYADETITILHVLHQSQNPDLHIETENPLGEAAGFIQSGDDEE